MRWQGRITGLIVLLSVVMSASASAAELTHDQYKERAEAICKVGTERARPLLERGFKELKDNAVRSAGPKLVRVAATYDSARGRLLGIPKPAEDAADLTAWLKRLDVQNMFLRKAGQALADAERVKAQGFLSRFVHNGNLANDLVLGFGFKYCLFNKNLPTGS